MARPIAFGLSRICLAASVLTAFMLTSGSADADESVSIWVPADVAKLRDALEQAPDGAAIHLAPGHYKGPFVIRKPLTLRAQVSGATRLFAPDDVPVVEIATTAGVTLEGLYISGGKYGVLVSRSTGITIRKSTIRNSRLAGIRVRLGSVEIYDNRIIDTRPPFGRGIEISNTIAWPRSIVAGNTISGHPLNGIAINMASMVVVDNNFITRNRKNGVAVREMSHVMIRDNVVAKNVENGIHVMDYSSATACRNRVTDTIPSPSEDGIRYGNGILVDFHSRLALGPNVLQGNAGDNIRTLAGAEIAMIPVGMQGGLCGDVSQH